MNLGGSRIYLPVSLFNIISQSKGSCIVYGCKDCIQYLKFLAFDLEILVSWPEPELPWQTALIRLVGILYFSILLSSILILCVVWFNQSVTMFYWKLCTMCYSWQNVDVVPFWAEVKFTLYQYLDDQVT